MKKICLFLMLTLLGKGVGYAQDEWMTSFEAAKMLALAQDKMVLMIWEESSYYPLPVMVNDEKGKSLVIDDLFNSPELIDLLWKHFVLVKVNEIEYGNLYDQIKNKRTFNYLSKFEDDSIKILDANGNILNVDEEVDYVLNLSEFVHRYALNTSFLNQELRNYRKEKSFYSAFYLASKYIDYAFYNIKDVRENLVNLSTIYLNEARGRLEVEDLDNKLGLEQRMDLLEIEQSLVLNKPKKVIRKLKRLEEAQLQGANVGLYAFMYFTAYRLLGDEENASIWRSKVSFVDMDKAKFILNNN